MSDKNTLPEEGKDAEVSHLPAPPPQVVPQASPAVQYDREAVNRLDRDYVPEDPPEHRVIPWLPDENHRQGYYGVGSDIDIYAEDS